MKSKKFSDWFKNLTSKASLYDKCGNKISDKEQLLDGVEIKKIKYNTKCTEKELCNRLKEMDEYCALDIFCGCVNIINGSNVYLYMPYTYLFRHNENGDTLKINYEYNEEDSSKIRRPENSLENVIEITTHSLYSTNIKDLYEVSKLRKCKVYDSIVGFLNYLFCHAILYDESNMTITSLNKLLCGECKLSKIKIFDGRMNENAKTIVVNNIDKLLKYGIGFNNKIKIIFVNKEN